MEEVATMSNAQHTIVSATKPRRGRQVVNRNRRQNIDDMNGMTSVVVTTSDVQHHELNDENVVAVSGIPGKLPLAFLVRVLRNRVNLSSHFFVEQQFVNEV